MPKFLKNRLFIGRCHLRRSNEVSAYPSLSQTSILPPLRAGPAKSVFWRSCEYSVFPIFIPFFRGCRIWLWPVVVLHFMVYRILVRMFYEPPITGPGLPSDDQNQTPVGDGGGASRLGLVQVT